jgi:hypothetical protein
MTTVLISPPSSVETYEFSFNRVTETMRFRLDGDEWNVKSIACKEGVQSVGVNAEGRWMIRCKLRVEGTQAFVYLPKDICKADYDFPQEATNLPETHWRLCYNRAGSEADKRPHWRLRDERTQELYSNDIRDYQGIVNINWLDGGPHVFHDGKVLIDSDGVAHFSP